MNSRQRRKFKREWKYKFDLGHLYSNWNLGNLDLISNMVLYLGKEKIKHLHKDSAFYFNNQKDYVIFTLKWS